MEDLLRVPIVQFNPNYLAIYTEILNRNFFPKRLETLLQNKPTYKYNGEMSKCTKIHCRKILTSWTDSIHKFDRYYYSELKNKQPYLTFVTLTLSSSQAHHDNEIKRKCLVPFIQELIRCKGVKYYFWRAESQTNGNIHFHLICDSYIYWKELKELWNKHQNTLNYVDKFKEKYKHSSPNSTDIHKLKNIKNVAAYVVKYVTKESEYRPIQGRIWGCSKELHLLKPHNTILDSEEVEILDKFKEQFPDKVIVKDTCTIFCGNIYKFINTNFPHYWKNIINYHKSVYMQLYEDKPPICQETDFLAVTEKTSVFDPNKLIQYKLQFIESLKF